MNYIFLFLIGYGLNNVHIIIKILFSYPLLILFAFFDKSGEGNAYVLGYIISAGVNYYKKKEKEKEDIARKQEKEREDIARKQEEDELRRLLIDKYKNENLSE